MSRTPPPPQIVAAAEQDLDAMRERLEVLVQTARRSLTEGFTPTEATVDAYLTLRYGDRSMAAAVGASAVMRIATEGEPALTIDGSGDDVHRP